MSVKRGARGFSLIEMLVVITLLAIGLSTISALFIAGTVSAKKSRRINAARHAARQQSERLASAGFAGCVVDPDIFSSTEGYSIIQSNPDGTGRIGFAPAGLGSGSQGTIDIAYYSSSTGYYPNLKDVTVTVTWPGGAATGGHYVLHALVANRP